MSFTLRPIGEEEINLFRTQLTLGFGGDLSEDDRKDTERFRDLVPLDRTVATFDGDRLVGTLGDFPLSVTLPGGRDLAMAGTTMVTVQPTHRRRGILRGMMTTHLDAARERGEPLAGLWASESSIYGRFGFGLAVDRVSVKMQGRGLDFGAEGRLTGVRMVESEEAAATMPAIYERCRPTRPGMLGRSETWWKWKFFHDPEKWREGQSAYRFAVYDGGDGPDGYVVYRQKEEWEEFFPNGKVAVNELMAVTGEAHDALWRFLVGIDLFPNVEYWNQPLDDELRWRVTEPRQVRREVFDSLWLRVLDVPAALAGRSYAIEGDLRIGIHDPMYRDNDGTYLLSATPDGAECWPVDEPPDLELEIDALGAILLGGRRLGSLARSGRVRGSANLIRHADSLFTWDPAPWCPEIF